MCQVLEISLLTGGALLYSSWTFLAVRNLNEISGVLEKKQSRRKRRRRLCWPGKEEDIISHWTYQDTSGQLWGLNLQQPQENWNHYFLFNLASLPLPFLWGAWQITPRSWFSSWSPATHPHSPSTDGAWVIRTLLSAEGRRQRMTGDWKQYRSDFQRVEMMAYVVFNLFCVSALVAQDSCSNCLQTVQHLSAKNKLKNTLHIWFWANQNLQIFSLKSIRNEGSKLMTTL